MTKLLLALFLLPLMASAAKVTVNGLAARELYDSLNIKVTAVIDDHTGMQYGTAKYGKEFGCHELLTRCHCMRLARTRLSNHEQSRRLVLVKDALHQGSDGHLIHMLGINGLVTRPSLDTFEKQRRGCWTSFVRMSALMLVRQTPRQSLYFYWPRH